MKTIKKSEIEFDYIFPPIPLRQFDWHCFVKGSEEISKYYGYGRTKEEALEDLKDNLSNYDYKIIN